jgi:hypothetical protein
MSGRIQQHPLMPSPDPGSPRGLSALIATTRRRLALAAGLGAVVIAGTLVAVTAGGHREASSNVVGGVLGAATGDTSGGSTAAPATGAATPAPTGGVSTGPGGSATPLPAPTQAPASGHPAASSAPAGPPPCTSAAVSTHQTLAAASGSLSRGRSTTITATIQNLSGSCVGAPQTAGFRIVKGGSVVGGHPASTAPQTWAHGAVITDRITLSSDNGDGSFQITAAWDAFAEQTPPVTVSESSACAGGDFSLSFSAPGSAQAGTTYTVDARITNTSDHSCPLSYTLQATIKNAAGTTVAGAGDGPASTGSTWAPGTAENESLSLAIPAGTPPGQYALTVSAPDYGLATQPVAITIS